MPRRAAGFSLIEMMTVITIFAILIVLGAPAFASWMTNQRVRTMAESIQNGMRLAQSVAAQRNTTATFILTNTSPPTCSSTPAATGRNWVVCTNSSTQVQAAIGDAGGKGINVASDFASVGFNGLGRTTLTNNSQIQLTSASGACESTGGSVRCLNILLSTGGKIRMCDPQRAAGDPLGCS
jgi:type IV fimbrial biogenesis protein FimT